MLSFPYRYGAVFVTVAIAVVVQFLVHLLRRQEKRNVSVLCKFLLVFLELIQFVDCHMQYLKTDF